MPRTLTAAIEEESAKSRLRVVDLVKIVFPSPIGTKYWSNSVFTYDGHTYEPRINSVGAWSRSMNPETDDVAIELGNVDGYITEIWNAVEMELAEVTLVRYYPDIDEAIDPLWTGYGGTVKLNEETVSWNIHFGFRGFTQRGLRKVACNCWKKFADGEYCPYDPEAGTPIGVCGTLASGCDSDDLTITVDDGTLYAAWEEIKIDNEIMLVTEISTNTLTVTRGYDGTTAASHSSSTNVLHASCNKYVQDCKRKHMFGPPIEVDGLRYFGGWTSYVPLGFMQYGKPPSGYPFSTHFMQSVVGNPSVQGRVIPACYGTVKLTGVPSVYSADALQYRHSLFLVCEGEITSVAVNTILVAGFPVDDCPTTYDPYPAEYDIFHNESCMIWWGTIGQRLSYAAWYATNVDQYPKNPYLINDDTTGDGQSLSDLFAIRIRIEEGGDEFTNDLPNLDIQFVGRKVRTIQGWIDDNPATITSYPDPIEVAVDYCVNKKFGPRLDITRIDLVTALTESTYCREIINNVDQAHVGNTNARFLFNGSLNDDQSVEKQLAYILDNCNGYFIQNDGKIQLKIRKAEAGDGVILTDYGSSRNILRDNGKSTLEVEETGTTDGYVNNMEVSFADSDQLFQTNTLYVYDDKMQDLAGKVISGDESRQVNTKQLKLVGTDTLDQAIRLGTLKLREEYLKKYKYTFKMSLKDSIGLTPGDVHILESVRVLSNVNRQMSKKAQYVRISKIEETDKFVAAIEAYAHNNDYYNNTLTQQDAISILS